jgi:hypothetical protein
MATDRVLNPKGEAVATEDIEAPTRQQRVVSR